MIDFIKFYINIIYVAEPPYPVWIQNHPDLRQIRACVLCISDDIALYKRYVTTVCPTIEQFRGALPHHFAIGSTVPPEMLPKGPEELDLVPVKAIRAKLETFLRANGLTPPDALELDLRPPSEHGDEE